MRVSFICFGILFLSSECKVASLKHSIAKKGTKIIFIMAV